MGHSGVPFFFCLKLILNTKKDNMVLHYKNKNTVFPKAVTYNGYVDIIFINNATKYAFAIKNLMEVWTNEVWREYEIEFPADAPYGEYTYVIAPPTVHEWVFKNEILDSTSGDGVLKDMMLETGLLIFVDEEEKAQPEYRERDKKHNESNYIYRKRKELEEKEPIVPPTPPTPPTPELKYSYAVGSVVPETATVKWYKDSSMAVEVFELEDIDDSSLYAYAEAEGYEPQGKTLYGEWNATVLAYFRLEPLTRVAWYKSTDDLIIDFENSTEWDNWGEGVKLVSNTYENGIGTLRFNNTPTHFCVVSIPNSEDKRRLKMIAPNNGLEVICNKFADGATNLTEVIIPDTVKTIEYNAFSGAHSLKSLTIPASVEEIQFDGLVTATFSELSAHLVDIKFLGNTPPTVDDDFIGRQKLTDLTVHYPAGADYSKLCSNVKYMFGYLGATCIADL